MARILDRFRDLYGETSSGFFSTDIRHGLLAAAEDVALVCDQTTWVDVEDYSSRRCQEMLLGGRVGRITYDASAGPFLPILRVDEILHVGKERSVRLRPNVRDS